MSDNELASKFGAGTTVWIADLDTSGSPSLCYHNYFWEQNRFLYIVPIGGTSGVPFGDVFVLVGIQNASKFDDVPTDILERLAKSVLKLTHAKFREGKIGTSSIRNSIKIMDDNLSDIYATVEATYNPDTGKFNIGKKSNHVQEAKAAERAQQLARQLEDERLSQIKARFDNFFQQTGATTMVGAEDLQSNPFRYEGTNIVVSATYRMMLDKNTSIFETRNGLLAVSGLDPKHSMSQGAEVLLAGTVTGTSQVPTPMRGSITAPLLSFRDIYVCQSNNCADILPK